VNTNIDVIRVQATEAALSSTLRAGMLGFASDTDRMGYKRLDNSVMKYWSEDTKQCLLAGNQTITGNKTYSGTSNFTGATTFNSTATFANIMSMTPLGIIAVVDGVTNLDPTVNSYIRADLNSSNPTANTVGILAAGLTNQLLLIACAGVTGIEIDDTVPGSATIELGLGNTKLAISSFETAQFVWAANSSTWSLISTTGVIS